MKVKIDKSNLQKCTAYISGLPENVLNPKVKEIVENHTMNMKGYTQDNIRANRSVRTTILWESISTSFENNGFKGIVGTNVFYNMYVEFGRGPVVPKRAKALKIPIGKKGIQNYHGPYIKQGASKFVFLRKVGPSKPKPYLIPAFDKTVKEFSKDIERLG